VNRKINRDRYEPKNKPGRIIQRMKCHLKSYDRPSLYSSLLSLNDLYHFFDDSGNLISNHKLIISCNALIDGNWVSLFPFLRIDCSLDIIVEDFMLKYNYIKDHYRLTHYDRLTLVCWLVKDSNNNFLTSKQLEVKPRTLSFHHSLLPLTMDFKT
jgi:hypothetical protein